jgi:hypothetical protein
MEGYRLGWPTGADKILLISVGTGSADPEVMKSGFTAGHAINALLSMMNDCASLQEIILQWLSSSPTAGVVDEEIGDLCNDLLAGTPLLTYMRYNVDLRKESVKRLNPRLTDEKRIESLSDMDAPENMEELHKLGVLAAELYVNSRDFEAKFDLS